MVQRGTETVQQMSQQGQREPIEAALHKDPTEEEGPWPTDRLGGLQVELGRQTRVTHEVEASRVDHRVRHDSVNNDLEDEVRRGFLGRGGAIVIRGCPGGKGLAVRQGQGHAGIFVSRMPRPRTSPTCATTSSKEGEAWSNCPARSAIQRPR